jgi:argininosuccinate synthase
MKTVLAYSGGLDTSVCIKWLQENYKTDVITLTIELGQKLDLKAIERKAEKLGAIKTYSIDAREEFVNGYLNQAVKANALYEGKYPVSTALSRPLIGKWLVEIAGRENADTVAHGSTGKGNDQVRFELAVRALNPELRIIAPAREWDLTRDKAVKYAEKHGIPIPPKSKYSTDENLAGRSIEAGPLEDPMKKPDEEAFEWTSSLEKAPDKPESIEIEFDKGVPVGINKKGIKGVELTQKLNELGGKHGIGRIDMIEDRLVGIKSREVYECPAMTILLEAHRELERLTLTREENLFKENVDRKWAHLVYFGQWYEPLKGDLDSFIDKSQEMVSGTLVMELYKGNSRIVGRSSPNSLYDMGLATYDKEDKFDHKLAEGFIRLWGLSSEIAGKRGRR